MIEWIVATVVYVSAVGAGAAVVISRSPGVALAMLVAALAVTPFEFIRTPPILGVTYLEVVVLVAAVGVAVQYHINGRSLRVATAAIAFVAYYILRLIVDIAVENATWLVYLRDVRPILAITAVVVVGEAIRRDTKQLVPRVILWAASAAVTIDVLTYGVGSSLGIDPAGIAGEFAARTGIVRYADALTIVLFGFLNYVFFIERSSRTRLWSLGLMLVVAALSFNRVAIAFVLLNAMVLTYDILVRRTGSRLMAAAVTTSVFGGVTFAAALYVARLLSAGGGEVLQRLREATDVSLLLTALGGRFVAPAVDAGYELDLFSLTFGVGPSFLFYVPWFEYRGLEPYHTSVDSFFFVAVVKYGLIGAALLSMVVARCLWRLPNRLGHAWFWVYMSVHNGIAVPAMLLFLLLSLATKPRYLMFARIEHAHLQAARGGLVVRLGPAVN